MYGFMEDAIALIRDRLVRAEVKAARAEKAWETAKNEVADLQTALRVMTELSGESPSSASAASSANVAERQLLIVRILRVGEGNATSPADIFDTYKFIATEEISIDTFRTTIWRMKDNSFSDGLDLWLVKGDNGRYWKEPGTIETRKRYEESQRAKMPVRPGPALEEYDDEVPF